jgi:hypothetical protein
VTTLPQAPLLDEENAAFIQGGVSIIAASRDTTNMPAVVRALGCRVSADRRRVTVFVARSQGVELLADVSATGALAVVFTLPSTHRAIQLKGTDAGVVPLEEGDGEIMARLIESFTADVAAFGYSAQLMNALLACEPPDAAAITFTPSAAFIQTPGARAGEPLRG